EVEQREGRILRQGNTNEEVAIYRYVTEKSFDSYMWQALETKARFISQIMTGESAVRRAEDIGGQELSYAEVADRQRIVEFLPTSPRRASRVPVRQRPVAIGGGPGSLPHRSPPDRVPCCIENALRGQPPAAAPRRAPCTTNSRRVSAPSVSASPAGPSSTSARRRAAPRPGSTSGGAAIWRPDPRASTT